MKDYTRKIGINLINKDIKCSLFIKGDDVEIKEGVIIMWFLGCALSCFLLGSTFATWWIQEDCIENGYSNIGQFHCDDNYGGMIK